MSASTIHGMPVARVYRAEVTTLPATTTYDRHIRARLVDFFTLDGLPWPRRLWDVGSLLALEELWEAGAWARQHVLSAAAVDWQRHQLLAVIGPDVGLGSKDLRRQLTTLLNAPLPDPSPARRQLHEVIRHARGGYLARWADAAKLPDSDRPRPERLARTVAAHLLDLGYDAGHLLTWATGLAREKATAVDVVESAVALDAAGLHEYQVLAVLDNTPERPMAQKHEAWVSGAEVIAWLRERGHSTSGMRPGGGFLYRLSARDPFSAASQARELVERMTARAAFMRNRRDGIRPNEHLYVDGHPDPVPFATPSRGADILSLVHEGHLYRVDGARRGIDDALELAAPINRGALGPAVAGAWAAIESLLVNPDDPHEEERSGKALAADRLGAIIACSWPRAELTALARRHHPDPADRLADEIATCTTNRDRARAVAAALIASETLHLGQGGYRSDSDVAAMCRMQNVLANPRRELGQASATFKIAMRRLYRTRNIVLHGGSTQGVALNAALRIAAPLVGAGLDRITHADLSENLTALDLAARAEVGLQLVDGETGLAVVDLVERRI
jgi:hypothetical protein